MSQFQSIEVENIGRNIRSRKMGVIAKTMDENNSRRCLQPIENHVVQKAKRVKLDVTPQKVILDFLCCYVHMCVVLK